jgi:RNA polymerase sigma factor (sigma-70 family)
MKSLTDQQLLADYAKHRTEAAFNELVRRYLDIVHSAALRMVLDPHLAEDVSQGAFIALAENAGKLTNHPVLAGWLHCTARNLAANAIRTDVRRRLREQEAASMNELLSATPDSYWEQIAPHLDAALGELAEPDRDAVLLRYFQKKSAAEMGEVLGISSEAAQKRLNRGLDRLRENLARRGVNVGAGGLVALLSAHAVQAAPAGLALTISTAASLACSISTTGTTTMAMTAIQKTLVAATVVVLASVGVYEARQASRLRDQVNILVQQQASLAEQAKRLQRERDEATNQAAALLEEKQRLPDNTAELLRLRGMAGVARRAIGEAEQLRAQLARQSAESTNNPITSAMADATRQAMERRLESQLARMAASLKLTPEQAQAAREILARQSRAMTAGMQQAFTGKFDKTELNRLGGNAGNTDEQIKELLTAEQQAAYPTYQKEEASHNASLAANHELLQLQSSLDLSANQLDGVYAALFEANVSQLTGGTQQNFANAAEALQWAADHKAAALAPLLTEAQMQNYRQQLEQQARLVREIMDRLENSASKK